MKKKILIIALWACAWLTVPVAGEEIAGSAALEAEQENINNIEDKLLELRELKDKCKYDNQFAISMFKKILENV